jgi:hypothetical protein
MKKLILILFLLISTILSATTYYVSTSGNDSNNGLTTSTPWKTLSKAEQTATSAGDIVALKKGDTWTISSSGGYGYCGLLFHLSGSVGNPIIWDGSLWGTGNNATIRASGYTDGVPMFDMIDAHYLTIQNLIFDGQSQYVSAIIIGGYWAPTYCSYTEGAQNDITIQDCVFNNIGSSSGESTYAILVSCYDQNYTNFTIQRNDINTVGQCGIGIYNGRTNMGAIGKETSNVYIGYNTIDNWSLNSTGEALLINNKVTNCIIEHNTCIYGAGDNAGFGLVIGSGDPQSGFYPTGIVVRYNEIRTKNQAALFIQSGGAFGVKIYYNLFYRNAHDASISSGAVATMPDLRAFTGSNLEFYNNTIVVNAAGSYCFGNSSPTTGIWHVKNNIFYHTGTPSTGAFYSSSTISDHNNNLYFITGGSNFASVGGTTYNSTTITTWESTSQKTNPLLTNTAGFDWTLQATSPAINHGATIATIPQVDYDGNALVGATDIGAYEYGSGTPPAPTPVFLKDKNGNFLKDKNGNLLKR